MAGVMATVLLVWGAFVVWATINVKAEDDGRVGIIIEK